MKRTNVVMTPRTRYENRRRIGIQALLLILVLTVVNIGIYALGNGSYFFVSAYVPYVFAMLGVDYIKGGEDYAAIPALGVFFLSIAAVILVFYVIFYVLGRKKIGWVIAGAACFGVDTLFVLLLTFVSGEPVGFILDILFHGIILWELIDSILCHYKLKKLPPEETAPTDGNSAEFKE